VTRPARALGAAAAFGLTLLSLATPAGATPGPPNAPEYWFDSWHVSSLWKSGARGQGVTIAEIDTGVNADVPELQGRILPGTDLGRGGNGQVDREVDAFGHGTAMASIMVARPGLLDITGLAPGARILPIAVPLNGTTDAGKPDKLPDAIRYAADHHARIISMSLGGKHSPLTDTEACDDNEQSAIFYAMRKGAVVLASVGNTGPDRNVVEDPGVCLGVVSVGAVDASGTVARFSTRQPYLTLVAPGVGVPSLGRVTGEAYSGDGTSQSTALASAVAALVWSRYPTLSARQVVARLLATVDAGRRTPSPAYGYGLLDAYRAVTGRVPADAPNPVFDAAAPFLSREQKLAADLRRRPPPAAAGTARSTGSYEVGSAPRVTRTVLAGVGGAAAGLLLLVALLIAGIRGRRRQVAPAAIGPALAPAPFTALPPPRPRPQPGPGEVVFHRPRPGPRPDRISGEPPDSAR
jgi:subtilisin family serine protease